MAVAGVFVVYGLILYIEAGVGYGSSRDRRSLLQGIVAGSILLIAAALVWFQVQVQIGASVGVGTTLAMLGYFGGRFSRSKKFMPAGLMLAISVVALGILSTQILR